MTTKVKVQITQRHMPVIVEVLQGNGNETHVRQVTLPELGSAVEEYVHSGQVLRVREMTTEEFHRSKL
jgi:hypothetical protein